MASKVAGIVGRGPAKDGLSGTWIGHPLQPMLTDLPIGFWTSAVVLDFVGGVAGRPAADRLVGLGVLSSLPTAASRLSDWSDTLGEERRIGAVHAPANGAALVLYGWSWVPRRLRRLQPRRGDTAARGHVRRGRLRDLPVARHGLFGWPTATWSTARPLATSPRYEVRSGGGRLSLRRARGPA